MHESKAAKQKALLAAINPLIAEGRSRSNVKAFASVVAVIPDPLTPPAMAPGFWYWCAPYQQYYPYVGACPTPWQRVAAQ